MKEMSGTQGIIQMLRISIKLYSKKYAFHLTYCSFHKQKCRIRENSTGFWTAHSYTRSLFQAKFPAWLR